MDINKFNMDMELDEELMEEMPEKSELKGNRGHRRKTDYQKAVSKKHKDASRGQHFVEHPWYDNLHQYSKGKIHCSCALCAFNYKRHGQVVFGKILPMGDQRKAEAMKAKLREYSEYPTAACE